MSLSACKSILACKDWDISWFLSFAPSVNDYLCDELLGLFHAYLDLLLNSSRTRVTPIYQEHMRSSASWIIPCKGEIYEKVFYYFLLEDIFLAGFNFHLLSPKQKRLWKMLLFYIPASWTWQDPSEHSLITASGNSGSPLSLYKWHTSIWLSKPAISDAEAKILTGCYRRGKGEL